MRRFFALAWLPGLWRSMLAWFEAGDLVPLMVMVSAVHYAVVLGRKDHPVVSIAIGVLVDLGHYRAVRAAVRYTAPKARRLRKGSWLVRLAAGIRAQVVVRWAAVCVMTAVSLTYHQRYYEDWWLSAPLPLLIAFLAWQHHVDRNVGKRKDAKTSEAPAQTERKPAPAAAYICRVCGESYASPQAYAGHMKSHAQVKRNGHEKEKVTP